MNNIFKNFWLRKGKNYYWIIYAFLYINIIFLFIGEGSLIERIKHNWHFFIILLIFILLFSIIWIILCHFLIKDTKDIEPIMLTSYSARIVYAIIGSLLLILGIAQLMYNFVSYGSPFYIYVTMFYFGSSFALWIISLLDQVHKEIKWSMLIKPRLSKSAINEKENYIFDDNTGRLEKKKKVIYIFLSLIIMLGVILTIIEIFFFNKPIEGIINIILTTLVTITVLFYICKK